MIHLKRMTPLCAWLLTACSGAVAPDGPEVDPPTAQARSAIVGGEPDPGHDAVVALLGAEHVCSGTIVATEPPLLFVLTAAHCVAPHAPTDPEAALLGRDYLEPDARFDIDHCLAAPGYDGERLDFAMCRATGATATTPFVAAASGSDGLAPGDPIEHVGYGMTEDDEDNSARYHAIGEIEGLDDRVLWYSQRDGGPCMGDSGGPQLSLGDEPRVVGVTSYGDLDCAEFGVSGRVASVYESFVAPYLASWLPEGAGGGAGAAGAESLGGGGAGGATGSAVGGAEPKWDEGPQAGSVLERPAGSRAEARCALVAGRRAPGSGWPAWIAALTLGSVLRRRSLRGGRGALLSGSRRARCG